MLRVTATVLLVIAVSASAQDAPEEGKKKLDEVLHGRIKSLKKDVVEIFYDFSDPEQLGDFVKYKPFKAEGELEATLDGETLRIKGTGALHLAATFLDTVSFDCDLTPWRDRNLGGVISEDLPETEQYVLFCINDLYFQRWDGGTKPGHMVCRFGVIDPSEPEGNKVFRYIARGTVPAIRTHQAVKFRAAKNKREYEMVIADKDYKGRGMGREISELHAGFYVIKSNLVLDNLTMRGRLSPRWLEKANVELALSEPLPEPTGPSPEELAAQARIRRFAAGAIEADDIFAIVENAKLSEEIRGSAAGALKASRDKRLVARLVSLLYSDDLLTRRLADTTVKGLTGKSFGYDPKGDDEKRSRAIKKLIQYIQKRPREFGVSK